MLKRKGRSLRSKMVNLSLGDSAKSAETASKDEAVKHHTSKAVLRKLPRK